MKPSKQGLSRLRNKNHFALLQLAQKVGNGDLYQELIAENDFEIISAKLGLTNDYLKYIKYFHSLDIKNSAEIAESILNYKTFLLEKICFPQ